MTHSKLTDLLTPTNTPASPAVQETNAVNSLINHNNGFLTFAQNFMDQSTATLAIAQAPANAATANTTQQTAIALTVNIQNALRTLLQ